MPEEGEEDEKTPTQTSTKVNSYFVSSLVQSVYLSNVTNFILAV